MHENEVWKQTKYNNYLVSNYGRVMSKGDKTNRYKRNTDLILTPSDNGKGYLFINIYGKLIYVHRLVAETFIPNPNNYREVNHKNKNRSDNNVNNLEWCDGKYNVAYSIGKKVKQINIKTNKVINIFDSANQAAKFVNGNNTCILMCCNKIKYTTYKGYIWKFINDDTDTYIKPYIKPSIKIVRTDIKTKEEIIYNSVREAAKANKVSIHTIYKCLSNNKIRNNYA